MFLFFLFEKTFDLWPSNQSLFIDFKNSSELEQYFRLYNNNGNIVETSIYDNVHTAKLTFNSEQSGNGNPAGIESKKYFKYGHFSCRMKSPDVSDQPKIGLVTSFFLYGASGEDGNGDGFLDISELDFEWLNADPERIYLTSHTSSGTPKEPSNGKFINRHARCVHMPDGDIIYDDIISLPGNESTRETIHIKGNPVKPISGYKASKFYTYGMDWYKKRAVYWMLNENNEKVILQEHTEHTPYLPMVIAANIWWTTNWAPSSVPDAVEKPNKEVSAYYDWFKYEPLEEGIDDYGNKTTNPSPSNESGNGTNVAAIVAPIVVIIVLGVLGVLGYLYYKKKKEERDSRSDIFDVFV